MLHEPVDIDRWKLMFPLEQLRAEARQFVIDRQRQTPENYPDPAAVEDHIALMSPRCDAITSPYDIAVREQLCEVALSPHISAAPVPVDVFIFARGEPENRALTKIGGLPYWPADRPWPRASDGEPMTFVGQFCLADSKDITGELPGDVLVIFGDERELFWEGNWEDDPSALQFHWMQLGETNLVRAEQTLKRERTEWEILPCYGDIYRTLDYPELGNEFIIEGTKIGGVPLWIQHEQPVGKTFLCALGSVQPVVQRPFPYVNVPDRIEGWTAESPLMWGDAGSVFVFLDDDRQAHWVMQCY